MVSARGLLNIPTALQPMTRNQGLPTPGIPVMPITMPSRYAISRMCSSLSRVVRVQAAPYPRLSTPARRRASYAGGRVGVDNPLSKPTAESIPLFRGVTLKTEMTA